ncbi:MAG: DUF1292 domain-containing protein [Clostridiaceae bacterium]|jgi:uncharacterized protein YrzB (UPF0473 family)|nr:DUF1292 domain-containing protein [Clostridiaceae bacterium]
MDAERDDIVVLVDENGEEVEFEHIDTVEMNGNEYVVLIPFSEDEDDDLEEEVVILRVEHSEDGDDTFVTIEDDDELEEVFSEFQSRLEEEFEDEED